MEHYTAFTIIPMVIGVVFIFILLYNFIKYSKFKHKMEENSYAEYKNENPNLVSNGKVICKICGGNEIGIMPMYSPTKHPDTISNPAAIAHICKHCGTTLYYSKVDE